MLRPFFKFVLAPAATTMPSHEDVAKRMSTETFVGRTVAEAELKLVVWRKAHPDATIVKETFERGSKSGGRKTTIHIEFTG